jgi:hypothetical protein
MIYSTYSGSIKFTAQRGKPYLAYKCVRELTTDTKTKSTHQTAAEMDVKMMLKKHYNVAKSILKRKTRKNKNCTHSESETFRAYVLALYGK